MSFAKKGRETGVLHLKSLPLALQPTNPFNIRRKTELGVMLHGILVNGTIERIEGNPEFAESEVLCLRAEGYAAEYLFGARSEDDFRQKDRTEKQRRSSGHDDAERERSYYEQHSCWKPQS